MKNQKLIAVGAVILGILFVVLGIYYWITPAGSLLAFIPGFVVNSPVHHHKHAIASIFLGLAAFALAWFQSGKKSAK